jgi:hypothetical protein
LGNALGADALAVALFGTAASLLRLPPGRGSPLITGISEQDAAVQDSQGLIHDRTREMLGPTDLGVSQLRALMLGAARDLAAGAAPAAAMNPAGYRVRSGTVVAPDALAFDAVMTRRFGHPKGRFDLVGGQAVAAE